MASAALMAGSGLLSGYLGSKGANEAAKTINQGTLDAIGANYNLYNQQRRDQAPYANAGAGAVNYLSYLLGIGGGPNGQSSGPQTPTTAQNQVNSVLWNGKHGKAVMNGQNGFIWKPDNHNDRSYTFMYVDGNGNDVYQRTGGMPGEGATNDFAIVGKDGQATFAAQPPVGQQFGQSGGNNQITDQMKSDPQFGSLMHDFGASDFTQDPGYDFRLNEGAKALQRSAAAKGRVFSGGTLKDLTNYNQNFASNEYGNAYNRFQTNRATKYNQLASLAGLGQVSVGQIGQDTNNLEGLNTNTKMEGTMNEANARASGYSSWANGLTNAANAGMNWYQMSKNGWRHDPIGGTPNWSGGSGQYNPMTGTYNP
jgi:hypothetical protein